MYAVYLVGGVLIFVVFRLYSSLTLPLSILITKLKNSDAHGISVFAGLFIFLSHCLTRSGPLLSEVWTGDFVTQ